MSPRIALSSLLISAGLAGVATAQVAPPPPPQTDPEPEFVPPPIPQPRPAPPPRPKTPEPTNSKLTADLPNLPYPPLWTFCGTEDPKVDDVCTFPENLHFVALRPNPTISPGMLPQIQSVIVARRSRLETMVIENLDVVEDIDGGLVLELSTSDLLAMQDLLERVKPLTPPTNLTQELQNRKILTATQARFNNKIIGEYQKTYGEFLRRSDPKGFSDRYMRSIFSNSLLESMQAFNGMLHESRVNIEAVLAKVDGVPSNVQTAMKALAIDDIEINPELIKESAEKVKLAWRPLSLEQKAAFLEAVRSLRETPDLPPVPVISVVHANKRIIENAGAAKVIDTNRERRAAREKLAEEEKKD